MSNNYDIKWQTPGFDTAKDSVLSRWEDDPFFSQTTDSLVAEQPEVIPQPEVLGHEGHSHGEATGDYKQIAPWFMEALYNTGVNPIQDFAKEKGVPQADIDAYDDFVKSGGVEGRIREVEHQYLGGDAGGNYIANRLYPGHGDKDVMNINPKSFDQGTNVGMIPGHEFGHAFAGHSPGSHALGEASARIPELNLYQKADRFLKGWLPSFSKHGARPFQKGNKRELWDDAGYDPYYGNHQFNMLGEAFEQTLSPIQRRRLNTGNIPLAEGGTYSEAPYEDLAQGDYKVYDKLSNKASDFRSAYKSARDAGDKTFTWDDRLYSSDL